MRFLIFTSIWLFSFKASSVFATEVNQHANFGDSFGRLVLGTLIVLLVISGLAWLARRYLPGQDGKQAGVIQHVGGLQLSPRERVVVLEVAGRWLVVGCHGGQMTALGDVDAPTSVSKAKVSEDKSTVLAQEQQVVQAFVDPNGSFANRLQQAMQQTLKRNLK